MKVRLIQNDITINQMFNPSYFRRDLKHYENQKERINKRIEQIKNLCSLLSENLSDEEFYKLVLSTYEIDFDNKAKFNLNLVSDYDLSLIVRYKSDKKFKDKFYTIKELFSLFSYEKIMLERINVVEYDEEYMKEHYDISNIERIDNDMLMGFYNYLKRDLDIINYDIVKDLREILTKERVLNDLNNLMSFTISELDCLESRDKELKLTS